MILITRPQQEAIKTQNVLLQHIIESLIEPLIEFKPYLNININYNNETLLVTSTNALRALISITKDRDYKIIAIGESTANFARENSFYNVIGAGKNMSDLINYVLKHCRHEKLLYISGTKISYPLDNMLSIRGFATKRVIVYGMLHSKKFSEKCYKALLNNKINGVVLFSLNTAKAFMDLISQYKLNGILKNIHAYSLSNNIANTLTEQYWKKIHTANLPTHDSLIDTIINN